MGIVTIIKVSPDSIEITIHLKDGLSFSRNVYAFNAYEGINMGDLVNVVLTDDEVLTITKQE
jgi:hypothetical protein